MLVPAYISIPIDAFGFQRVEVNFRGTTFLDHVRGAEMINVMMRADQHAEIFEFRADLA